MKEKAEDLPVSVMLLTPFEKLSSVWKHFLRKPWAKLAGFLMISL